jgi:hypothetical protein
MAVMVHVHLVVLARAIPVVLVPPIVTRSVIQVLAP